jgi:hypothetical protein
MGCSVSTITKAEFNNDGDLAALQKLQNVAFQPETRIFTNISQDVVLISAPSDVSTATCIVASDPRKDNYSSSSDNDDQDGNVFLDLSEGSLDCKLIKNEIEKPVAERHIALLSKIVGTGSRACFLSFGQSLSPLIMARFCGCGEYPVKLQHDAISTLILDLWVVLC